MTRCLPDWPRRIRLAQILYNSSANGALCIVMVVVAAWLSWRCCDCGRSGDLGGVRGLVVRLVVHVSVAVVAADA